MHIYSKYLCIFSEIFKLTISVSIGEDWRDTQMSNFVRQKRKKKRPGN